MSCPRCRREQETGAIIHQRLNNARGVDSVAGFMLGEPSVTGRLHSHRTAAVARFRSSRHCFGCASQQYNKDVSLKFGFCCCLLFVLFSLFFSLDAFENPLKGLHELRSKLFHYNPPAVLGRSKLLSVGKARIVRLFLLLLLLPGTPCRVPGKDAYSNIRRNLL